MGLLENILSHLKQMPQQQLEEIMELISTIEKKGDSDEYREWSRFTLESAMLNFVEEREQDEYTLEDIKEFYR